MALTVHLVYGLAWYLVPVFRCRCVRPSSVTFHVALVRHFCSAYPFSEVNAVSLLIRVLRQYSRFLLRCLPGPFLIFL